MLTNRFLVGLAALLFQGAASAQTPTEKIWGVFAYTLYGDSTPKAVASSGSQVLTEYGATTLSAAGTGFRDRYLTAGGGDVGGTGIEDISPYILDSEEVVVFSTTEQYVTASAQAFMQGLYPPLSQTLNMSYYDLANGTQTASLLNGYQYARVITLGLADPQSVSLAGQAKCSLHHEAEKEYRRSSQAQAMTQEYNDFYVTLWHSVLSGVYPESSATYTNAVDISNYLNYEAVHNDSLISSISGEDIKRARWLADQYVYVTNSPNASSLSPGSGGINAIAGQTLAASILHAFEANIQKRGLQRKMTLLFGSDETAVALASLAGLADQSQSNFYSRPLRGGSLIFELYSLETNPNPAYPRTDNLYVRFFLHNGTSSSTPFEIFPLFGHGPSRSFIPYSEFRLEMGRLAVVSTQDWCTRCHSSSIFCTGVMDGHSSTAGNKRAPAGVIGAVVTVSVIGLLVVVSIFVSLRCKRRGYKRSLGGFKGAGKLASDTDVTFRNPIWGMSKTEQPQQSGNSAGGVLVRRQPRLGSWEMGQQSKEIEHVDSGDNEQAISPFDDENEEEWRKHSGLKPVKVRESV